MKEEMTIMRGTSDRCSAAGRAAVLALLTAGGAAGAAAQTTVSIDETMIRNLAPEVHLTTYGDNGSGSGKDWTRPANIDWFLNPHVKDGNDTVGAAMLFNQNEKAGVPLQCLSDDLIASAGTLSRDNVGSSQWKEQYKQGLLCKHSGPYHYATQQNPNGGLTLSYFFLQPRKGDGKGGDYDKVHHGIYGGGNGANPTKFKSSGAGESRADLEKNDIFPDAAPAVGLWVLYAHVQVPSRFGGAADLQYWTYYPYDDAIGGFNHESDWEHVSVTVDSAGNVISVYLSEHENGTQFVPDDTVEHKCQGGFISRYRMALNGGSERVCLGFSSEAGGRHAIVYSADGSHALYPSGCTPMCTWNGYAGGTSDYTTAAGPAWKGWLVNGGSKNYEIVTDSTNWLQYANLWGEIGSTDVTTGKPSPRWQSWGLTSDEHPNKDR
jgi:hypothetical protein